MVFKVLISPEAKQDLRNILNYCIETLNNAQAAYNIFVDAENTKLRLSHIANSLRHREDLGATTFQTIHFKKHKYLMVYRIIDRETVRVYRIYHTSRNIENELKKIIKNL